MRQGERESFPNPYTSLPRTRYMANRLQRQRPSLPPILLHSTLALAIARMSGATWLGMSLLAVTPSVMAQSNSVHTFNILSLIHI